MSPRGGGDPREELRKLYLEALKTAAEQESGLDADTASGITDDLQRFAEQLKEGIEKLPAKRQAALRRAVEIVQEAAATLDRQLLGRIGSARAVSFRDTFQLMAEAQRRAADALDIPRSDLGAIPLPRLADAHAFAAVAERYDYRTLARGHVVNAGKDAIAIIRRGIVQGTKPDAIARAIRPYVIGAADIPADVADLRTIPAAYRGAAKQLDYNAKRLAFSETHAARMIAQAARMRDDPFVLGAKWHTAPNRGKVRVPDICDVLRDADFFGLGPGIYPAGRIPAPPHPWDRCVTTVVPRKIAAGEDWRAPKPAPDSYRLRLDPATDDLPHLAEMTPAAQARVRRDLAFLLAA